jgi:hypothetical protein
MNCFSSKVELKKDGKKKAEKHDVYHVEWILIGNSCHKVAVFVVQIRRCRDSCLIH